MRNRGIKLHRSRVMYMNELFPLGFKESNYLFVLLGKHFHQGGEVDFLRLGSKTSSKLVVLATIFILQGAASQED